MSVKIKVSYQHKQELDNIVAKLGIKPVDVKSSGNTEGKFKKAYIEL